VKKTHCVGVDTLSELTHERESVISDTLPVVGILID
jgi:hypothetical protein